MINIQSITISEFRGIRSLSLNLKGKNFAVCGPNGTGKSGIVDAIEFGLTGSISRLTGADTGGLSVKQHGPHVDCRNRPKDAVVAITIFIPSLKKEVTLTRSVSDPKAVTIVPDEPGIREILEQVALHPEFVLSRRELIRYVLAAPAKRSSEVQALLRLNQVDTARALLQKIANASKLKARNSTNTKNFAATALTRALNIPKMGIQAVLDAANERRLTLNLPKLTALDRETSLKDGISTVAANQQNSVVVVKSSALQDLAGLNDWLLHIKSPEFTEGMATARAKLAALLVDEKLLKHTSKEAFLRAALREIENDICPVCDTPWDSAALAELLRRKLEAYSETSKKRKALESELEPFVTALSSLASLASSAAQHAQKLKPPIDTGDLRTAAAALVENSAKLQSLLPIPDALHALDAFPTAMQNDVATLAAIQQAVNLLPDASRQDAAKEFLIVAQERLVAYQDAARRAAEDALEERIATQVFLKYGEVTTAALDDIYSNVEGTFSELYRYVNRDDESAFQAKLQPSLGKLGFDVDFYGRGFFPPGAYHSEGHQDGMGLCLYLALMQHLSGKSFTLAVLDDVLMSVDSGHRREVSRMLKDKFPNTQFFFTTHDDIWLRHMKTVGLVEPRNFAHFRTWSVDIGPTEWDDRDVWAEIDAYVKKGEVSAAAALLRHFLEYFAKETCHALRAPVDFRGDGQFTLGDLLPNAVGKLNKLLKAGTKAAISWKQPAPPPGVTSIQSKLDPAVKDSHVEQWQINSAVHYNEWANLRTEDFAPVVDAYKRLTAAFACDVCGGLLALTMVGPTPDALRCSCGTLTVHLKAKA